MGSLNSLTDMVAGAGSDVRVAAVLVNLAIAAALAYALRLVYVRFATSLSNRRVFSANFILLATTTTLIITIVKSSLALSLGLVGALSIVRFRAAIKEPEELAYLFLTIAIGLGLGADQRLLTVAAFAVITILIVVGGLRRKVSADQNLYVTVTSSGNAGVTLAQIVDTMSPHCAALSLRRFDERDDGLEAAFMADFDDFRQLEAGQKALRELNPSLRVSFADHRNIL